MEKIIKIGDKDVKFKSTAGTMIRYRNHFKRDFIKDLIQLQNSMKKKSENNIDFEIIDLEIFERIAWCMAKTANQDIPELENWLDDFESFDIVKILPEIMSLLIDNMGTISNQKKSPPKKSK